MSPFVYRYLLVPGRHHMLTRFQASYFGDLLGGWLTDIADRPLHFEAEPTVIWAVTSANHQNTRRNPVPANRREVAIELFGVREAMRTLVVPVVDVPATDRFAEVTLKAVTSATGEQLVLTPENTVVATSTPAMIAMYAELGFAIAPIELNHPEAPPRAWDVVAMLAAGDESWRRWAHPASIDVLDRYGLDEHIRMVVADPIAGDEGSLTTTREYRTYAAAFEAAAQRKWAQARPFIVPGRIVDIGCASGGMLELAAADAGLAESDLYGIEISRHLYEECVHKKAQGCFANPNTFFYQRNVLSGPVFAAQSVDTTMSFALTHEVFSYAGGHGALERFVRAIHEQTRPGGVWINSDVVGPGEPDEMVRLRFHDAGTAGVRTEALDMSGWAREEVAARLAGMVPAERFAQFAQDFVANAGATFVYEVIDETTVALRLADAMEFLTRFSYTDNWLSETHEQFCAMTYERWVELVTSCGFRVDARSGAWRNDWLVDKVLAPAAEILTVNGKPRPWPVTHALLVAQRPFGGHI